MSTIKNSKHYETLKSLYPLAVRLGFVGEWEEIEDCKLDQFGNHHATMNICVWNESGVAGDYLRFLRFKMGITHLNKIPEKYNKRGDYVCVDGETYCIGDKYWFSADGREWKEDELKGYVARDYPECKWVGVEFTYRHISKTKPTAPGPTPDQIDSIKTLYPDAVKLERAIDAIWYVLQKERGLITTVYVPNSELWPYVIKLGEGS